MHIIFEFIQEEKTSILNGVLQQVKNMRLTKISF